MGSKAQGKKSSEYAKWMKDHFIIRRTTICPVCYVPAKLPYPTSHNCTRNGKPKYR